MNRQAVQDLNEKWGIADKVVKILTRPIAGDMLLECLDPKRKMNHCQKNQAMLHTIASE